jgi:hypothetical protein
MKQDDLKIELARLQLQYEIDRKEVYRKFAYANNPYKIGDVISDHHTTIEIKKIGVYISYGESSCIYTGTQLNKDGKPNKKQDATTIYQINIGKK